VDAPKFSASVRLDAEQPIGSFALKGALDYNANAAADRFNVLQGKMV
jgi:hypothetical protein